MKKCILVAAIAALCVPVIALGQPVAKPSPSTPVQVTNDASVPVPIAGSVTILNQPSTQTVSGTVDVASLPAAQAVNIWAQQSFSNYVAIKSVYTNTGARPVVLTAMSASVYSSAPCSTTGPVTASFDVVNQPGGTVGGPNTASIEAPFNGARARIPSAGCTWTATFSGSIVVGPGQSLDGYAELNTQSPAGFNVYWSASGHEL